MDKVSYKVPSKEDLKKRSRKAIKGIRKHLVLNRELDNLVCEYARKLDVSQASVMSELMMVGIKRFEEIHGYRITENKYGENKEKNIESLTEQLNEKYKLMIEEKKANASKRTNDLSDAYSRQIAHGNSDEWQSQGY